MMSAQKDIKIINRISDEKTIKADLMCTNISGAIYWRGIPIENFGKNQLTKIIYLLMEDE